MQTLLDISDDLNTAYESLQKELRRTDFSQMKTGRISKMTGSAYGISNASAENLAMLSLALSNVLITLSLATENLYDGITEYSDEPFSNMSTEFNDIAKSAKQCSKLASKVSKNFKMNRKHHDTLDRKR